MKRISKTLVALVLALAATACGAEEEDDEDEIVALPAGFDPSAAYAPNVSGASLSENITNPLFPAPVGAKWRYEAHVDGKTERVEISVEAGTKAVWGATARVVRDTVYVDDELVEDTWDWYGQDAEGIVWYLGEDTKEYENGQVKCACGAWTSGQDGALPGIIMLATPKVGEAYRQEYFKGEAEDVAEVVAIDETVSVPAGKFSGCIKTRDVSVVDRSVEEFKFYCPGVGLVLDLDGDERTELVEYSGL
jgi:hypothetical protein